jgi:hypothetical protein
VADQSIPRTTATRAAGRSAENRRRALPATPPVPRTPPPRPALTSDLAPPSGPSRPEWPTAALVSAVLWFTGCAAGAFGLIVATMDQAAVRAQLTATATADDPTAAPDVVASGVRATVLVVLGTMTVLIAVTLVWTLLVLRRRSWARWALLGTGLLTLFAADVTQSVVGGGVDLDRLGLIAQAVLVALAMGSLFAPSTRAWLAGPGD